MTEQTPEQVVAEALKSELGYHNAKVRTAVVAALREAGMLVEPEWERQYGRRNRETGAVHVLLAGDPLDDWWHENQDRYEHIQRIVSPWLPVELKREEQA